MPYYGRKVTSAEADFGTVGDGVQRASVYEVMPDNGWGHTIGIWAGKQSGSPSVELGAWKADGSMNPAGRMGYGVAFSPATVMADIAGGQSYEAAFAAVDLEFSPGGGSPKAIKMVAGDRYAIGPQVNGGTLGHSMIAAARISADNEKFYERTGTSTPTDPFSYSSSSNEGHISAWIEYQRNRTPRTDILSPSGTIGSSTPSISGTFVDSDTVYGDQMTKYRVYVRRSSDNALMWDSGIKTPSSSEQAADEFQIFYAGTALTPGVSYYSQCKVADEFGTWSSLSDPKTFTLNGGGAVTLTAPTGKQETRQPGPITGTWSHVSGLSTNALEARIKNGSGSVIKSSATIASVVANGGPISIAWATAFGSYNLGWGGSYSIEVRGRDSSSLWSDWKAISITTNAAPSIPSGLTPTGGDASSNRPTLTCTVTDADDTVGTGLVVKARVYNSGGSLIGTYSMSQGTGNTWTLATTSTHVPSFGSYSWDAYAGDGTLWSGAVTSEASATASARASFVYADGPAITISTPTEAEVLTTGTPSIDWSVTFSGGATQVSYRVVVSRQSDGEVVKDTGTVIDSSTSAYVMPSAILRDGETYELVVFVTDSNALTGTSTVRTFSIDYVEPPEITGFVASSEYVTFDAAASAVRLTWDASTEPDFAEYIIGVRETGTDADSELVLARITSSATTAYVYYFPESGVDLTFSIRQSTTQGLDTTTSARVESQATATLDHVVVCDTAEPATYRVGLHLDSDRGFNHVDDLVLEHGWGEEAPFGIYGTADYEQFSGSFTLATDDIASAKNFISALRSLKSRRSTVCYRDERGRKFFGVISKLQERDKRVQSYEADIEITEVSHDEGVD